MGEGWGRRGVFGGRIFYEREGSGVGEKASGVNLCG